MIKRLSTITAILTITLLSSCELIGSIFKAGYYVGIFVVLAVLVMIFGIYHYISKR